MTKQAELERITWHIIKCAMKVHRALGPGLFVIELKTVAAILPVHHAQLLTYLKLTGKPIGLLLNFNVPLLKDGIVRKINTHKPDEEATIGLA